jgi:hypothetical protein
VLPRKDLLQIIVQEYSQFCAFAENVNTIPEIKRGRCNGNVNNDGLPSEFFIKDVISPLGHNTKIRNQTHLLRLIQTVFEESSLVFVFTIHDFANFKINRF